jgi:tetratricopeptide (TPR) repeat protein
MVNGRFEDALPVLERCLSIRREHLPTEHRSLAECVGQLSLCCENLGDIQRAKELASEALSIATCCLPNDHPRIAFYISQLPNCHGRAGRTDEAIVGIEQSIDIRKKNLPSTRSDLSACECMSYEKQLFITLKASGFDLTVFPLFTVIASLLLCPVS